MPSLAKYSAAFAPLNAVGGAKANEVCRQEEGTFAQNFIMNTKIDFRNQ
jgi:hypothetical protein